jgi:hypothetical protein
VRTTSTRCRQREGRQEGSRRIWRTWRRGRAISSLLRSQACGTNPLLLTSASTRGIDGENAIQVRKMVIDESELGLDDIGVQANDSLGQLLPTTTNSYHDRLRSKNTTETQFRILVTYPIFTTLILPRICYNFDIDANRHFVDDVSNSHVKLVLWISHVGFLYLFCFWLARC